MQTRNLKTGEVRSPSTTDRGRTDPPARADGCACWTGSILVSRRYEEVIPPYAFLLPAAAALTRRLATCRLPPAPMLIRPPRPDFARSTIPKGDPVSLMFPGLGQIYNKYCKLPIVYGPWDPPDYSLQSQSYKDTAFCFPEPNEASRTGATAADSADYFKIRSPLENTPLKPSKYYRDSLAGTSTTRLFCLRILLWGLNVVDAAVRRPPQVV